MSDPNRILISPARVWEAVNLGELWRFRRLALLLFRRDLVKRYRQTLLGPVWLVLPPLVKTCLITIVFGWFAGFDSEQLPYALFAYAAMLPWELFAGGSKRGIESLVKHVSLMEQAYFPRLILPASETATALVDFAISFLFLVGLAGYYGYVPTARLFVIPILLLVPIQLALIVSFIGAAGLARYRDTRFIVSYLLQGWFYLTPIAYSTDALLPRLPGWAADLYELNPMIGVVQGFRWAITGVGRAPGMSLFVSTIVLTALLYVAARVFRRVEGRIVDVL